MNPRRPLAERLEAARAEDLYEERAGILEFMAGFNRVDAEIRARLETPRHVPGSSEPPRGTHHHQETSGAMP
jgi:hypothetical protein